MAGTVDPNACIKAARFIECCHAFGLALIYFQDVPGFCPGPQSERTGIIRYSAKLLYRLANAMVPRISILIRKVYGLARYGMCNMEFRLNLMVGWPTVEASSIDHEDAVEIMFRRTMSKSSEWEKIKAQKVVEFKRKTRLADALEAGLIDDVIDPRGIGPSSLKPCEWLRKEEEGSLSSATE